MTSRESLACIAAALVAVPAQAQFGGFLDDLKDRAQKSAEDEIGHQTEQKTRGAVRDSMNPKDAPKNDAQTSSQGTPPAAQATSGAGAVAVPAAEAKPGAPAPEVYGNRYDFVPGDKVLAYDDFSDTDIGEYPAKWTMKDGGGNAVEVVEIGGKRFMKARYLPDGQPESLQWLRYEVKGDLPKKFTVEFDADLAAPYAFKLSGQHGWDGPLVKFNCDWEAGVVRTANAFGSFRYGEGVRHVAIAVSGTQVKVYVGGERVLSDPDGVERPIQRLGMMFVAVQPSDAFRRAGDRQMVTNFRLAEGGKDAKTMLAGEGRIITHGILFDTGSDVIKPESGPTLRSIQTLLTDDAALRFRIEGHTDDQGGPKVNGPLSERRAQAVKAWLVKQGIPEKRLEAKGLGATKPIDTNETAEGRANNRRVEFVRLGVPGS